MNNAWAIIIAGGTYFVLSGVWYGFCGPTWLRELKRKHDDLNPRNPVPYLTALTGCMLNAWALNQVLVSTAIDTVGAGAVTGIIVCLTLTAATAAKHYSFAGWSLKLFLIDYGGDLVGFTIMGALLNLPLYLK